MLVHVFRTRRPIYWAFIIFFTPLLGSLIYFIVELLPEIMGNPKTKKTFWEEKFKANIERDIKVKNELKSNGWRVLVVWECELTDIESVGKELGKFLKNS